jgi:NCAIR mutase (PurE)-related protein
MARRRPPLSRYACLDLEREARTGIPEVILAEGKRKEHLVEIVKRMLETKGRAIITRISKGNMEILRFPGYDRQDHPEAGIMVLKRKGYRTKVHGGTVAIITAGTSDFAVGEEARVVAEELGCKVESFHDVGVAGVHRLFDTLEDLDLSSIDVFIVIAGREGALPTLVSGLVDAPVIGVPVSTGYGKGGKGEAALMAMLQSCSPLVVVNIDAGFVAGVVAARIANKMGDARKGGTKEAPVKKGKSRKGRQRTTRKRTTKKK